jgi:hypothetical protein
MSENEATSKRPFETRITPGTASGHQPEQTSVVYFSGFPFVESKYMNRGEKRRKFKKMP